MIFRNGQCVRLRFWVWLNDECRMNDEARMSNTAGNESCVNHFVQVGSLVIKSFVIH